MKKLNQVSPYSDQFLIWNPTFEEYELKFDFVNSDFANTFGDSDILQKRIKTNSRVVYNYIYSHCYSSNAPLVKKLINNTEEGRKFILSVLTTQMRIDLENGYNDTNLTPSINTSNGQIISREEIKRNQIGVETEEKILTYNNIYFGINIMVACAFPITVRSFLL